MKKSDLRTGMIVELRNKERFLVQKQVNLYAKDTIPTDIILNGENGRYISLHSYNDNLLDENDEYLDIIKVYELDYIGGIVKCNFEDMDTYLTWERDKTEPFEIGSIVKIIDDGFAYTTFENFSNETFQQCISRYCYNELPRKTCKYTIIGYGEHNNAPNRYIYVLENYKRQIFLIGKDGIEKV